MPTSQTTLEMEILGYLIVGVTVFISGVMLLGMVSDFFPSSDKKNRPLEPNRGNDDSRASSRERTPVRGELTSDQRDNVRTFCAAHQAKMEGNKALAAALYRKSGLHPQIIEANIAEMDGDNVKAIAAHRRFLHEYPNHGGMWQSLGQLLIAEKKHEQAVEVFCIARKHLEQVLQSQSTSKNDRNGSEAAHLAMAQAVGIVDGRVGFRAGTQTKFEQVFGRPPLPTEELVMLQEGDEPLDYRSDLYPRVPVQVSRWLMGFDSGRDEIRDELEMRHDPRREDDFSWEENADEGKNPGGFDSWLHFAADLLRRENTRFAVRAFAIVLRQRYLALEMAHKGEGEWQMPPAIEEACKAVDELFLRPENRKDESELALRLKVLIEAHSQSQPPPRRSRAPKGKGAKPGTEGKATAGGHGTKLRKRKKC